VSCFAAPDPKLNESIIKSLAVDPIGEALYIGVLGQRDLSLFKIPFDAPARDIDPSHSDIVQAPASAASASAASSASAPNSATPVNPSTPSALPPS
jgi:hypothetical protein